MILKKLLPLFCIVLISFLYTSLHAQGTELRFRRLTIEDGLSQNSAYSIVQDNYGFVWIASEAGLNKYDGYKVTTFYSEEGNPNSLSNGLVNTIYEDKSDILWIGTENGLNSFDPRKDIFTRYLNDPEDLNSINNNRIFTICEDRKGMLWIGTEFGLNKYDRENKKFTCYQRFPDNPNSINHNNIRAVFEDKSGTIWIGTYGGGLNKFNRKKERFSHYLHDPEDPFSISSNFILCIYEDFSGTLWIGTEDEGLNQFDRENGQFISYKHNPLKLNSLSSDHINVLYEDKKGTFWIGTNDRGLDIFDRKNKDFFNYQNNPDNPYSLSDNRVTSIYEDNNGGLWFGTHAGGVNIYNRESQKFIHYKHTLNNPNSLSYNNIRPIFQDRSGIIWIGTDGGGLNKFDRRSGSFNHFKHNPHYQHSLSDNRVFAIYEDTTGAFWIGTHGGGLNKFNRENGRFAHYKHNPLDPHSLSDNKIRDICSNHPDTLWIGTNGGGLNKFDRISGTFIHYLHNPDDSTSLSNNRIYCLYIDQYNDLWIGTFGGGLNKFNRKTEQFIRYQYVSSDAGSISDNFILSIYEDETGILWIGTLYGGLNEFDRDVGVFTSYTKKDGLLDNVIYDILEDDHGNLWLTTNNGIAKFNPQTITCKSYDVKDGLQSNEFNTGTGCKLGTGEMLFGGINGFNIFHPDSIRDNPNIPIVVITDFQLFNRSVPIGERIEGRTILEHSIAETKEIRLSYTDNVFSFEFAALHYVSPDKNQYAYMMAGIETEWNYVGSNRRYVSYAHLPPGEYRLKVIASNNDGIWNKTGTSLKITIIPPFWQTWWFYLLWIIILIIVVYYAYNYQVHRLIQQQEEEERRKVYTDVNQVLERGKATVYRRNFDSDNYDYLGEGIKDITGYAPEEFSLSLWNKIVTSIEIIGELSGQSLEEVFTRLRNGSIDSFVMDFRFQTKSDETRWARDITTGIRNEKGECYAAFGILFDITDRKLAEQELAQTSTELRLRNEVMETDLNMAREIQSAILSKHHKHFPLHVPKSKSTLQFSHYYKPATTLAGDFFDILPISDHEVGILICDVMGHGARASLLTFFLRGLIEELVPIATDTSLFMQRMNNGLNSIMGRFYTGIFATAFYGVADISSGKFRYTNAGHPTPFIINKKKKTAEILKMNGSKPEPAIGIHEDFKFSTNECTLAYEDIIFFYTDGIYETVNKEGKLYGRKRLLSFVQKVVPTSPDRLMKIVLEEIRNFSNAEELTDDVCLVTMHVKNTLPKKSS